MNLSHPDLTLVKPGKVETDPDGVDLFTVCRNEAALLPHFLDHYRALGINRIFVIDNGSTDETAALLADMDDVWHILSTGHYFSANDGCDWVRAIVKDTALGRWGIFADADELLVYPGFEDISLPILTEALDSLGAEGLFAFMLDCYSPALFDETPYQPGQPFLEAAPLFDGHGYFAGLTPEEKAGADSPDVFIRGGVRHRLLDWTSLGGVPTLRKVPLAKATNGAPAWTGSHSVTRRKLAGMTGALLHFKFLGKPLDVLQADVENDGRGAHQPVYESYVRLRETGAPDPVDPDITVRWRDSLQLVELGLCALPQSGLKALRTALHKRYTRKVFQPIMARLRKSSYLARDAFPVSAGAAFQTLNRY